MLRGSKLLSPTPTSQNDSRCIGVKSVFLPRPFLPSNLDLSPRHWTLTTAQLVRRTLHPIRARNHPPSLQGALSQEVRNARRTCHH
jgi:hypothetical protein